MSGRAGPKKNFHQCWPRLRQRKMKPRGKSPPRKPGVTCLPLAIVSESCLRFCSWSEAREEIRAAPQQRTSMPFGLAIWGQFVLWVALPGVSAATIGKDGESTGRRGLQQKKKTGLMESLFGAKSHTQRQLIWGGVLGGQAGMNSNSPRPNSAILNYWWISSPPRFDWGKPHSRPYAPLWRNQISAFFIFLCTTLDSVRFPPISNRHVFDKNQHLHIL